MTLTQYLENHSLTDEAFAALVGVDRSTVTRWRESRIPKPQVMRKIAEATGGAVTANDFYGLPI